MTVMKSIIYKSAQEVVTEEKALPEIAGDEVLIKVAYAGICGSDMFIYQGVHPRAKAPLVMGHEFSGLIEKGHPTLPKGTPVTVYPATLLRPVRTVQEWLSVRL